MIASVPSRRRAAGSLLLLAALAACAKVGPPPGGPEDRDPPTVDEVVPPTGAAAVAVDSAVVLVFSERPDRRSVMRGLTVIPPVVFRQSSWEEGRLTLLPRDGWAAGRSTLLRIDAEAKDRRGNRLGETYTTWFTTKAVADTGVVTGRVWPGRESSRRSRAAVLAFDASADSLPDPDVAHPDAFAEPDSRGEFRLEGLDTAHLWRIVGILDVDGDFRALTPGEARGEPPGLVRFDPATFDTTGPVAAAPGFLIGTLDSLGTISGEIQADSGSTTVAFAEAAADSADAADVAGAADTGDPEDGSPTALPTARAVVEGGGAFRLEVPTGRRYRVGAFVDTDGDSLPGPGERLTETESPVELLLAPVRAGLTLDLRTPADSLANPLPPLPEPIDRGLAAPDSLPPPDATDAPAAASPQPGTGP